MCTADFLMPTPRRRCPTPEQALPARDGNSRISRFRERRPRPSSFLRRCVRMRAKKRRRYTAHPGDQSHLPASAVSRFCRLQNRLQNSSQRMPQRRIDEHEDFIAARTRRAATHRRWKQQQGGCLIARHQHQDGRNAARHHHAQAGLHDIERTDALRPTEPHRPPVAAMIAP